MPLPRRQRGELGWMQLNASQNLQKVLAYRYDYDLDFCAASVMLRVKRMNAIIDPNIKVQITVVRGSKFNNSKRGEL